jgi:hypothetical protein
MIAAEARRNTEVRARVALAVRTSARTVSDLLDGYEGQPTLAARIRAALAVEGVDLTTLPKRTPGEVQVWKRRRHPRLANAMPDGYAIEACDCGAEYPRDTRAEVGRCPKCWWRRADALERELAEARAENEGLQKRLSESGTRRSK